MKTLVVVPTPETRHRLESIFLNAPMNIDFSALLVPLAFVSDDQAKNFKYSDKVYAAKFAEYRILYDEARNQSELVGVLNSPDMRDRVSGLGVSQEFLFKLIFLPHAPAQSTSVRNFNVSISETLVAREPQPFTFHREYLL